MAADDLPPGVPGERTTVHTNGVRLHCVEAGNPDGSLVVLLHGFPEFWYGWHEAIAPLASDGYRVVVPDQRGYNRSEKPDGVAAYRIEELAEDVAGLIERFGRESAHVVGHDWGGGVAWWLALTRPELVDHLVAVNAPHPAVLEREVPRNARLLARNWHAVGAQLPWLPEFVCKRRNWRLVCRSMASSSATGTFSDDDFRRYRRAWSRAGAFTAMLNWQRALIRYRPEVPGDRVTVPTRVVWGADDRFLPWRLGRQSADRCEDSTMALVDGATHWVHHEFPVRVVGEVREHIAPPGTM